MFINTLVGWVGESRGDQKNLGFKKGGSKKNTACMRRDKKFLRADKSQFGCKNKNLKKIALRAILCHTFNSRQNISMNITCRNVTEIKVQNIGETNTCFCKIS